MELMNAQAARRPALAAVLLLAAAISSAFVSFAGAPPMRTMSTYAQQTIALDERSIKYYQAKPKGEGTWRGLLLAHDAMGVDKAMTQLADRLAIQGFIVMVPDLYAGKIALDADKGREMAILADRQEAAAILSSMASHMKNLPDLGNHRVGLLGFGFGGQVALAGGGASMDLSAVVTVCSNPFADLENLRPIGVPNLSIYCEKAETRKPQDIDAFRTVLKGASRDALVSVYPGAGPDFMEVPVEGKGAESIGQAWSSVIAFLNERL